MFPPGGRTTNKPAAEKPKKTTPPKKRLPVPEKTRFSARLAEKKVDENSDEGLDFDDIDEGKTVPRRSA